MIHLLETLQTMKLYQLLLCIVYAAMFSACTINESENRIKQAETNLTGPVLIEGDSTWTIEARMAHYGVPGVSIAVIDGNQIAWSKSYGVVDTQSHEAVTSQTRFQAASISKPVAAYGALRLVLENKLALDEDINEYLKTWHLPENEWTDQQRVTLKQLLSHTAGTTVHGFAGYSPDLAVPSLVQVLNGAAPANSPAIRVDKLPGESFRYSGGGYCIVQQAMIDVSGKPFREVMDELVLHPLGMQHSTYEQPLTGEALKLAATGYLPDGSMTTGRRHTYPEFAAAGLWTTAEDLAKFAIDIQQTLAGQSSTVLSQEMAEAMLTPYVADFIGLGVFLEKRKDDNYFLHGGWNEGFSSMLVAHEEKGYGVVVMTNANQPQFIDELIRSVALTYGWDNYVPVYRKAPGSHPTAIEGRYRSGNESMTTVYRKGDEIWSKELGGNETELVRIADSTFVTRESDRHIRFRLDKTSGDRQLTVINPYTGDTAAVYTLMKPGEKLPYEQLIKGDFAGALDAYQRLAKSHPKDAAVDEGRLNQLGYQLLGSGKTKLAQQLFEINIHLYPNSSNVYDSYAEASMKLGDLDRAAANYKKSLTLDPNNDNAVKMLGEIEIQQQRRKTQ